MSDPANYTIAWICAIGTELVAAKQFLDETHDDADQLPANDDNTYVLGRIARHNIVIAALPHGQYGLVSAAIVARDMVRSFRNLRFALMVGIGGGAPSKKHDIRLGDIVVSSPDSGTGGVFQYDFGKTMQGATFEVTGHLNQSPQCLLRAIPFLEADYESDGNGIDAKVARVLEKKPLLRSKYGKPSSTTDRLFSSVYKHAGDKDQECTAICVDTELIVRSVRSEEQDSPKIHFGLIASANQLMKDASIRDRLSSEKDVLCFEMEAAGLMNQFPCLVIRGICDYSDTHKNKVWQGYAAMAAAAYAKDLLCKVAPNKIEAEQRLVDVLYDVDSKLGSIDSQVQATYAEIKSTRTNNHANDIVRWLAPPDVSSNLNKAIKARHPGSGRRLLESEVYTTWKSGRGSFAWLHGIPGCGKTILASTIIEDLQKDQSQSPSQTVLYFYFDFTNSRKQSFENTLRSLVCQMYHQSANAQKHLDSLYEPDCRGGTKQPSCDSLQKVFIEMVCDLKEVWIVLDALDECTPRKELLSWLGSIAADCSMQVNMHLLVTSRPEQDITWTIRRYASDEQIIPIGANLLRADIRNYVQARVREDEGLSRWRGYVEIQNTIEASLLEKANGMFRWVSCQLDALEDCLERKALLRALRTLPETLDETYERILADIPLSHAHHTRRILQFLTYSKRPLRLEEAVDAIAVDVRKGVARGHRFDPENRLPRPDEIARYCSSLVVLVPRLDLGGKNQKVMEMQLAHFSVKDYLTSDRLKGHISPYLQEMCARTSIAKVCLVYLLEFLQSRAPKKPSHAFYFAQYSAQYWASHAKIGERTSEYVFELAKELFSSFTLLQKWRSLCNLNQPDSLMPTRDSIPLPLGYTPPAIYFASVLGLPRCVKMLLGKDPDINARGIRYDNALQAAISEGHQEVVRLLLKFKTDQYYANSERSTHSSSAVGRDQKESDEGAEMYPKKRKRID